MSGFSAGMSGVRPESEGTQNVCFVAVSGFMLGCTIFQPMRSQPTCGNGSCGRQIQVGEQIELHQEQQPEFESLVK